MKSMSKILSLLLFGLFALTGVCQNTNDGRWSFFNRQSDSLKRGENFELSFGQNLLFISSSKQLNIRVKESIVVPTSSILFFTELRPQKLIRVPVFVNVATESKQFLINGQLINDKSAPTLGSGVVMELVKFKVDSESQIELEGGPLVSAIFDSANRVRFSPVLALRMRISRGENFAMYLGLNYSIGVKAFGIMYGTGSVF